MHKEITCRFAQMFSWVMVGGLQKKGVPSRAEGSRKMALKNATSNFFSSKRG